MKQIKDFKELEKGKRYKIVCEDEDVFIESNFEYVKFKDSLIKMSSLKNFNCKFYEVEEQKNIIEKAKKIGITTEDVKQTHKILSKKIEKHKEKYGYPLKLNEFNTLTQCNLNLEIC